MLRTKVPATVAGAVTVASIAILIASTPTKAADFTVQNGQTVGQQTLTTPGDVGTIDAGGAINTGGDGVFDPGAVNDLTVINNGSITAGADGVDIDGDNGVILNNGTITAGDNGLELDDGHTVTNNGTITANDDGILADNGNTITNNGNITANDDGINVDNNNTVVNSGTIIGDDEGVEIDNNNTVFNSGLISARTGEGIEADDDNRIENSGTIQNTGNDDGIRIDDRNVVVNTGTITSRIRDGIDGDNGNTVINSGTIRGGTGPGDNGIDLDNRSTIVNSGLIEGRRGVLLNSAGVGNGSAITNSGTVRSTNGPAGNAIRYLGNRPDTLTLLPGSIIEGTIRMGGGTDTLNVGNGLSIASTFQGGPEILNANGAPFARLGGLIVVVDPTAIGAQDEIFSDLTSSIFNSVHARLEGRGGSASSGFGGENIAQFGATANLGSANVGPTGISNDKGGFWAQAFGAQSDEDASSPSVAFEHELYGGIAGIDAVVMQGLLIGAFGGASSGDLDVAFNSQSLDINSYFGGVYGEMSNSTSFLRIVLTAGSSNNDSTRRVANNLVVGGLEFATASFDGDFISPEVTVGTTLHMGGIVVQPSARLRYAHVSLDGYTETGTAGPLTVADRDIDLWQGRLQLAFPRKTDVGIFSPRIGVEGRSSDEGNISATLLGQAISFNTGGEDDDVTGFAGATLTSTFAEGVSGLLDAEVHFGDDGIGRTEIRGGITVRY